MRLGVGDDAAITVPGGATATSVDALVDGVHFRRRTTPLRAIGHKALAAALSDLAAMGAGPGEAYVALGVPTDLGADECIEIYDGLRSLAAGTGTVLAGGDVTRSPALSLTVTVVGHAPAATALVRRDGAAPGQVVAVTGRLGGAAAGLLLLERADLLDVVGAEVSGRLIVRHQEPRPRLAEGLALAEAGTAAMIDLSDGLGADARQVGDASGAELRIELGRLPIDDGVREVAAAAGVDPIELAAAGGEDYELLVCLSPDRLEAATLRLERIGTPLTPIGEVVAGSGVELLSPSGARRPAAGFDQLRH